MLQVSQVESNSLEMKGFVFCFLLFTQVLYINAQASKAECDTDADCMSNSHCIESKCQCMEGFVEVKKLFKKVCLPYASLENEFSCEADEQCSLINDESNPKGNPATCSLLRRVCSCKESSWYPSQDEERNSINPICVRGFGSSCDNDNQCERSIPNAICEENKCACGEDYVTLEDEHMCLPYATEEENHCLVDEQCSKMHDSFGHILFNKHPRCDNNTASCVCHKEHFAIYNNTCVRGYGAKCGLLRKCGIENSKCALTSLTCDCAFGYKPNEITNKCEKRWSCEQDTQCQENEQCVENTCQGEKETELSKPECETDADCMENGFCVENKCQCQQGFVEVKQWLKKVCLPYATLENGLACDVDEQCSLIQDESNPKGNPATCKLFWKVCGCKESTWYPDQDDQNTQNPVCVRGFDSQCQADEQCQRNIPNGMCLENKCSCSEDFIKMEDENMCLPYATDEENFCVIDEQCSRMKDSQGHLFNKHPVCDNTTSECVCHADKWILKNSTCVRGLGARCGPLRQCGIENSKCGLFSLKCECKDGYEPNEETNTCEEKPEIVKEKESQTQKRRRFVQKS